MNFVFIFAAKLAINNDMSKDFFKELTPVAIRDYYKSLSKWRKRSIPTHSEWLYPLTFDAGNGLKEA